jgi:hypothetical protein
LVKLVELSDYSLSMERAYLQDILNQRALFTDLLSIEQHHLVNHRILRREVIFFLDLAQTQEFLEYDSSFDI